MKKNITKRILLSIFIVGMIFSMDLSGLQQNQTETTNFEGREIKIRSAAIGNHNPIYLGNNTAADLFFAGNGTLGTPESPHILKDLIINSTVNYGKIIEFVDINRSIIIQNCTIDGLNTNNTYGIYFTNNKNIIVKNCTIINNQRTGIYIDSSSENILIQNCTIINNQYDFYSNSGEAIIITGKFNQIVNNLIKNNGVGIDIGHEDFHFNNITGNNITENKIGLITSGAGYGNNISGNFIYDNGMNNVFYNIVGLFGDLYKYNIVGNIDTDGDGLLDIDEILIHNTNHTIVDTDGDNLMDGFELQIGYDPTNPDTDDDGIIDSLDYYSSGEIFVSPKPSAITNHLWQEIQTGLYLVNCTDKDEVTWMIGNIDAQGEGEIRLTYNETNPTTTIPKEGTSFSGYYSIETSGISTVDYHFDMNFYFKADSYNASEIENLCVYKLIDGKWEQLISEVDTTNLKIKVEDVDVNYVYVIGIKTENSSGNGSSGIPGFPILTLLLTLGIGITFSANKIQKKANKKKKNSEI